MYLFYRYQILTFQRVQVPDSASFFIKTDGTLEKHPEERNKRTEKTKKQQDNRETTFRKNGIKEKYSGTSETINQR